MRALCIVLMLTVAATANAETFRIGGAALFADEMQELAAEFQRGAPTCQAAMFSKTTGKGFTDLIEGAIDITAASRKINDQERAEAAKKNLQIGEKTFGKACLSIITNAKNPVSELSMDQLRRIFTGEITNWAQEGGQDEKIRVTMRSVPDTGAGVLFQEAVLRGAPYCKDAQVMQSYRTTVQVCSKSMSIGYIPTTSTFFAKLSEEGVKEIRLKTGERPAVGAPRGIAPDTDFPISIPLILYWNQKTENKCIDGFIQHCAKVLGK